MDAFRVFDHGADVDPQQLVDQIFDICEEVDAIFMDLVAAASIYHIIGTVALILTWPPTEAESLSFGSASMSTVLFLTWSYVVEQVMAHMVDRDVIDGIRRVCWLVILFMRTARAVLQVLRQERIHRVAAGLIRIQF